MINGKKLIICTPSGRKQCLEILANYIKKDWDIIDEWQLWVNTTDELDLEYIKELAGTDKRIILKHVDPKYPMDPLNRQWNLHLFYRDCKEDAVYIRIDDDICYIEPGAIKRLAEFRLENPKPFIAYGNTLNNSLMSYIQTRLGNFTIEHGIPKYETFDEVGLKSGEFFLDVHKDVLKSVKDGTLDKYKFGKWMLYDYEHYSITVSSFLGETIKNLGRDVQPNDELELNIEIPKLLGEYNIILGDALFVHYRYYYQMESLRAMEVDIDSYLKEYYQLSLV